MLHGTTIEGITYCNTKFGNVYEAREDHSQHLLATLQDHGLESHILMISPFSPYAYACILHVHKNNFYTFNRPSNRRRCNGLEKTLTNLFKGCHIINGRDIVRITIKACVICRLAMEKSIPLQAGKVPWPSYLAQDNIIWPAG